MALEWMAMVGAALANGGPVAGPIQAPSGRITLRQEANIRLVSERLHIVMSDDLSHYTVDAEYVLANPDGARSLSYGVPFLDWLDFDAKEPGIEVTVGGTVHRCERIEPAESGLGGALQEEFDVVGRAWCVFPLTIPQGEAVPLRLSYRSQPLFSDSETNKRLLTTFSRRVLLYELSPAGFWAGKADKVDITVELGARAELARVVGPPGGVREGRTVRWSLLQADLKALPNLQIDYSATALLQQTQLQELARSGHSSGLASRTKITSSSSLAASGDLTYTPTNLTDANLKTAWCEGASGPGVGEWLELEVAPGEPLCGSGPFLSGLLMVPGYAKSTGTWTGNGRVRSVQVDRCPDSPNEPDKWDTTSGQLPVDETSLALPYAWLSLSGAQDFFTAESDSLSKGGSYCVRVSLDDVAPGGGADEDTCISELQLITACN